MNKMFICVIFLCLAVLAIGPAGAVYGAKVVPPFGGALPIGTPLVPFNPALGQNAFRISYWDQNGPGYDASDAVYLQFEGPALGALKTVKIGDIRLTGNDPYLIYAPGSIVAAADLDIGMHLQPLPALPAGVAAGFYFLDLDGVTGYGLNDPVYLKTQSAGVGLGNNDIRITGFPLPVPGPGTGPGTITTVLAADALIPLTPFKGWGAGGIPALGLGFTTAAPALPIAQLAFYNANGNVDGAGNPIYDVDPALPDLVYLDVAPLGVVSANDIELFI
jgi:hypothetical protein